MSDILKYENEFFGTQPHVLMMKRSRDLWLLLKDNPIYSNYGRMLSIVGSQGGDDAERLAALVRLTGAGSFHYYPADKSDALVAKLNDMGLSAGRWEKQWGGEDAYKAAKTIIANASLPSDLKVVRLSKDTPATLVRETAQLSMDCGVMPTPGFSMRGITYKGICLAAVDETGRPVATASSYKNMHPESAFANDGFWGALATHPDRRGEKIIGVLGAMALAHMWEEHGVRGFFTAVKKGNDGSMAVCAKQAVLPTEWTAVAATDPNHFGDTALTK